MASPKLHLDADTSIKRLHQSLVGQGFDVTRTPSAWITANADDEAQLLGATAQGRCLFTFKAGDFAVLARRYPQHHGLILAAQRSWRLADLIKALTRLLSETEAADWPGQVRWLNEWRET